MKLMMFLSCLFFFGEHIYFSLNNLDIARIFSVTSDSATNSNNIIMHQLALRTQS